MNKIGGGVELTIYSSYLVHFGVKGMKWGVRKYRDKSGNLTALGKKRYAVKAARKEVQSNPYSREKVASYNYAKREFRDAKAKAALARQKTKPKRQEDLEKRYLKEGMSQKDAELAAFKRARTERMLAVAGGMTVAALAAYAAYKHYDKVTDRVIKQGAQFGRIERGNKDKSVYDAFYAYTHKKDEFKYVGTLGQSHPFGDTKSYKKTLNVMKNLKVASPASARKVLQESIKKDPKLKRSLSDLFTQYQALEKLPNPQGRVYRKARKDFNAGKITDNVYNFANLRLVDRDFADKFQSHLKRAGYDAVRDLNDERWSGYGTKNPLIIFNASKIAVDNVRELGKDEVQKSADKFTRYLITTATTELGATVTGLYGGIILAATAVNKSGSNRFAKDYLRKHPRTTMSLNEIKREYEAGRLK